MYMYPFFILFVFLMARANSAYHPHLLFRRYVVIRNQTLSKLLIDQADPVKIRRKNTKSNRNKLSYSGIIFYGLSLLLCLFSLVMALIPDIPCDTFIFSSRYMYLTGSSLNQKLPFVFSLILLFAEGAFYFINTSKYAVETTTAKKFTRVLYILFIIFFSGGVIGGLWVTITTLFETL